jgi:clan AA aspartic protease
MLSSDVGLTAQVLTVRPSRNSRRKAEVRFLVDSGAVYSLVPAAILRKLGLRPYREVSFSLADGTIISRKVGDAYFEINGNRGPAPVIFGEEGDEPLLGATTLESLGLVLDPFKRRLIPMRMVLASNLVTVRLRAQSG